MKQNLIIRFANILDLPAIVYIYNQAIRTKCATGDLNEFMVDERKEWFDKFDINKYPIYVVEIAGKIVGYCTLSPYRPNRKAMQNVAEISYYLDYSFHSKGIGTKLLKHVIADCNRINLKSRENFLP